MRSQAAVVVCLGAFWAGLLLLLLVPGSSLGCLGAAQGVRGGCLGSSGFYPTHSASPCSWVLGQVPEVLLPQPLGTTVPAPRAGPFTELGREVKEVSRVTPNPQAPQNTQLPQTVFAASFCLSFFTLALNLS